MGGFEVTNAADPTTPQSLATRSWVLGVVGVGPRHLDLNFSFADTGVGPLLLGTIPAGLYVQSVVLEVITLFNRSIAVEVGTLAAPAELMLGTDSDREVPDRYNVHGDLKYAVDTDLYLTMIVPGVPPGAGTGKVIVYFG
jgi:hypothetical protein